MSGSPQLRDYVADLIDPEPQAEIVSYFGGWAVRYDGRQVAMIMDTVYVRTELLEATGIDVTDLAPFSYATRLRRVEVSAYRAAPADLLDSPEHLLTVLTASNQ